MRELGIRIGELASGPEDAITDVRGVRVGHSTIVRGEGPLVAGEGPIRTGVTVVCPREGLARDEPAFAGSHTFNGNGEMSGLEWIGEAGTLSSPVAITSTHSVGVVRDALVRAEMETRTGESGDTFLAFAPGNRGLPPDGLPEPPATVPLQMVTNDYMNPLFRAVAEATEAAILNALLAAGDMTGRDGITAYGLTPELLLGAFEEARR